MTEKTPSPFRVVLYQPEIPQNTGNVARTCAATHTPLHLIEPLGFRLSDRYLKRAGLDYWPNVQLRVHSDFRSARLELESCRWIHFSASARHTCFDFAFLPGDCLVFGSETKGLPSEMLNSEHVLTIPIDRERVRSLNLSTAVGVVLFEAIRQVGMA